MFLVPLILIASTLHAGPERALTPPVPDASPYLQAVTSVAAGNGVALVVWKEEFARFAAARIDRDGRPLDAHPITLAAGDDAARGAGNWLVAGYHEAKVTAQLVRDDGTVGEPLTVTTVPAAGPVLRQVRVAFDGTSYLVVWNQTDWIGAALLDANGRLIEQGLISTAADVYEELDLVALDGGFAVVTVHFDYTRRESTVEVFRLDGDAGLVSYGWLDRTSTATVSDLHAIADGETIVATWLNTGIGFSQVFLAREGQPFRVLATNHVPVGITLIGGTVYAALQARNHESDVSLVSEDGTRTWDWPEAIFGIDAGVFGDRALLAANARAAHGDVIITVVDASLEQVTPTAPVTLEPALQAHPSIARGADGRSLVVWIESGHGNWATLMAARVDGAGRPIDPRPAAIADNLVPVDWLPRPEVAFDGDGWLVVWNNNGAVESRRVLRDGTPAGSTAFVGRVFENSRVCVAWNGREYLAGFAWYHDDRRPPRPAVTRISRDNVPGSPAELAGPGVGSGVACAAAGSDTLFAWSSGSVIVREDGTTLGPLDLPEVTAIVSGGERFAVTTQVFDGFDDRYKIERAIVSRQGTVFHVPASRIDGKNPALAATRDGFVLAWESDDDLYALELDEEGRAAGEPVALSATATREHEPALAGGDVPIAVYMKELASPLPYRYRVFTRTLGDGGPRRRAARH